MISLLIAAAQTQWVTYVPTKSNGKTVVLLSGDEEYRSEEGLPQLAKILARQGFRCTVLFSLNPAGEIDPNTKDNEPGLEALDKADLCVMLLRFRTWPDAQMRHFVDYFRSGRPIIALRTSTHAFDYPAGSVHARYGWNNKDWPGGFGKQVLGETWISHWGNHGQEATRGVITPKTKSPLLNGVTAIFGTTDVYEAAPPPDADVLVRGEVVAGLNPTDPPAVRSKKTTTGVEQDVNHPMMPIVWTRRYQNEAGKTNLILTTTMGAATDLLNEGLRRLLVNGAYWATGLRVPKKANVDIVGDYHPGPFGFNGFKKGVRPVDLNGRT